MLRKGVLPSLSLAYRKQSAALLIGSSLARKSYLVKQEHFKMVPRVMADDPNCESCAYKTDEDEVCLEYEFQWKLGWEWSQDMI